MKYRNYSNRGNFIVLGLLLFLFLGGFRLLLVLIPLALVLIVNLFPLILLGLLLRSIFKNHRISSYVNSDTRDHARFVELLVRVLVHVLKADGNVDRREIKVIHDFFQVNMQYNPVQLAWVDDLIQQSIRNNVALDELCGEFKESFNYESRLILLQLTYRVVHSDQVFSQSERDLITQIVRLLAISDSDHDRIRALFSQEDADDHHYAVLGLKRGASKDEIKKAYKSACKQNHPDKVFHLGEEFRKVAEEKMRQLNKSYEVLIKQVS